MKTRKTLNQESKRKYLKDAIQEGSCSSSCLVDLWPLVLMRGVCSLSAIVAVVVTERDAGGRIKDRAERRLVY